MDEGRREGKSREPMPLDEWAGESPRVEGAAPRTRRPLPNSPGSGPKKIGTAHP